MKKIILMLICICAYAINGNAQTLYFNGFENPDDILDWFDDDDYSGFGDAARVASGTGGITSAGGSWHGLMTDDGNTSITGPFTRFDMYRDTWPGWYAASVDVYLDTGWASGFGFDYSVASNGTDNLHQRDFIFHITKDTSTDKLLVGGSNNTNFATRQDLENINNYEVTQSGWYTFQHYFRNVGGQLAVDLNLYNSSGSLLFTETRTDAADLIPSVVGGNRYGWFTTIGDPVNGGSIAIDNVSLALVPEPSTYLMFSLGLVGLAFYGRKKRKVNKLI